MPSIITHAAAPTHQSDVAVTEVAGKVAEPVEHTHPVPLILVMGGAPQVGSAVHDANEVADVVVGGGVGGLVDGQEARGAGAAAAVGAARHCGQTASSHHRVAVERTQRGSGHRRAGDEKAHGEG